MAVLALVVGMLIGALLGAALAALVAVRRRSAMTAELAVADARARDAEARLAEERAALTATIEQVSAKMVLSGTERLAELAGERFDQAAQALRSDLDVRDARLKGTVDPIATLLAQYRDQLGQMEKERVGAYQGLLEQVTALKASGEGLRTETQSLVTALHAPQVRGRWGEMQLRRVVEMAGMVEHCDFVEQETAVTDGSISRPDMVVLMPGGRSVVVDAKVPLDAYLLGLEARDEATRIEATRSHARQLRNHIDTLSKKAYWSQFDDTPDFVVCFIPGEGLLAAAFEADPTIVEHAMEGKVLLASPVTLVALLRTVGFGWREEAMAENARQVQQLGQEIYRRLATMGGHLGKLGRSLESSVVNFNKAVSSVETRVLVTARRFEELGVVAGDQDQLAVIEPVDALAATPSAPELTGSSDDAPTG
jgi:DNA recombination protein RmuC